MGSDFATGATGGDPGGDSAAGEAYVIFGSAPSDTTAPRIASITRSSPTSSPTNSDSVTWRVTFNETVKNVTAADFSVSGTTGTIGINNVSGTVTDVTVSGGNMASLNATITLSLAGGQDIADSADNALSNTTPTGTN